MKRKLLAIFLVLTLSVGLVACGTDSPDVNTGNGTDVEVPSGGSDSDGEPYKISVIIKATDSDYWQTLLLGAKAAEADSNGKIVVTTDGPPSEIDIEEQVSILENVIATQPDGIAIASTSTDATVPAVEEAMGMGIPVITIDNKLNTDNYTSFLATDHGLAAGMVADAMVKDWEDRGVDPEGKKVIVISSVAGTKVNTDRTEGFINRIQELVPGIQVLETQYADNDISKALSIAENTMAANPDLIGIFGDNNHMGVGISRAIEEAGKQDDVVAYAFDADPDEIEAIKNGVLRGIVVQDPFGMGYQGVMSAVAYLEGETVEKDVVVDATIVTLDNMDEPDIQKLLYPGQ